MRGMLPLSIIRRVLWGTVGLSAGALACGFAFRPSTEEVCAHLLSLEGNLDATRLASLEEVCLRAIERRKDARGTLRFVRMMYCLSWANDLRQAGRC